MKTAQFQFEFDAASVPRLPAELRGAHRGNGRMIVLERRRGTTTHARFSAIEDYLRAGDLLVLNDSYVLPNTLRFHHGAVLAWLTLCGYQPDGTGLASIKWEEPLVEGMTLQSSDDEQFSCTLRARDSAGFWQVAFEPAEALVSMLERYGVRIGALPNQRLGGRPAAWGELSSWRTAPAAYRSVYARVPGSLQIPSAGLHFSESILASLSKRGIEIAYITLHVGASELLPARRIREEHIEDHRVGAEFFEVGSTAAAQIRGARAQGRRIIAVGTTVMRTLETLAAGMPAGSELAARAGWTDLYIYPGFEFKIVDALLTNLHRPCSTHLVLTAAFAGYDLIMKSYAEMIAAGGYEFDMFGDSMLIV